MTDMTVNIPDFLPVLRHGVGEKPTDGGCLMQCASFLAHGTWDDRPECVHDYLNELGIRVNDAVGDEARRRLSPVIPALLNTDTAYTDWRKTATEDDVRMFWALRAKFARRQFVNAAVRACRCCERAVYLSAEPANAAANFVRCILENAAGILWHDEAFVDDNEYGQTHTRTRPDQQAILVAIYAAIVTDFNAALAIKPVEVKPQEWAALNAHMASA